MPELPIIKLTQCPDLTCTSKILYKDNINDILLDLNKVTGLFSPHYHRTGTTSRIPSVAYLAGWRNKNSQRIRWVGPNRLLKSVLIAPIQGTKRGVKPVKESWELVSLQVTTSVWRDLLEEETRKTLSQEQVPAKDDAMFFVNEMFKQDKH